MGKFKTEREVYVSINNGLFLDVDKIINIIEAKYNDLFISDISDIKIKAKARYIFS